MTYNCCLGGACVVMVIGGARGIMVVVVGNGHGVVNSNLDETDCISHSTNTLGKGMNPIILLWVNSRAD